MIRDVATGRFVDRDKLHYVDFTGKYFSVKGPSITPRPPQGQPVVAALAHQLPVYEFAARSVDLVFITRDDDAARAILGQVRNAGGTDLLVYADVFVSFSGNVDVRSDALVFDGSPADLVRLLTRWQKLGLDGFRLRPSVTPPTCPPSSTKWCRCYRVTACSVPHTATASSCENDSGCPWPTIATPG